MSRFLRIARVIIGNLALVLAAWAIVAPSAVAEEKILSFDSQIAVQPDGTLVVSETIRVRAEGRNIRRGIYREFPTIYPGRDGRQVIVGFEFQSATRDGQSEPWRTEQVGNGVRIYLGSASVMLPPGEHTYEIVYRTDRQMGFFADHDELYWNVTGNGWGFPIERASATVRLPPEIPANDIRLEAYTGPQGAKDQNYTAQLDAGAPRFELTRRLNPREGLTIVVMWPKGFISASVENAIPATPSSSASPGYDYSRDAGSAPGGNDGRSPAENLLNMDLPNDSRPVLFGFIGLALVLGYYYFIWDKVGRDPPGRVIIPEYEMPDKQSAASMRYLLRMGYDNECFAACVLSLAVKGHLRIEQSDGILGLGRKYTLVRESSGNPKPLSLDERKLLDALFAGGSRLELEKENHRRVSSSRSAHQGALKSQYSSTFFHINGGWHMLGILLSLMAGAFALAWPGAADEWPRWYLTAPLGWLTIVTVLTGLIANGVFGKLLKAPTVAGQTAMDHIRGFKAYLEVAEGEDLKRINAPPPPRMTSQLYEAYLPAALALDVEQRWAEKFARVLDIEEPNYHPAWYVGSGWNPARVGSFTSGLGSSLSSAISSSSQAPGSKSGGGGGGSSGGGGGGGGGGGW